MTKKADEWEVADEILALPAAELHEALLAGTFVKFAQRGDITLGEDAEWRGMVEVPQNLWEADELEHVG